MERLKLIQKLEAIQEKIETIEEQVNHETIDSMFYRFFRDRETRFLHDKEIKTKALAFWKRPPVPVSTI